METSSPVTGITNLTGQLLVSEKCIGHCECLDCTKCVYCGSCEECKICTKCQSCKYPARQLKKTNRALLSNDKIKRRIGTKSKPLTITPLASEKEILAPKITKVETKCVGDNLNLETKRVGDKKPTGVETKSVGDNNSKLILVPENNRTKVSKIINFNVDVKVSDLSDKERKMIQFCRRRITINNRRLFVQKNFRETGLITQKGTFRLHTSSDVEFWVTVSLVGFTDIVIPRCGLELLGSINFCPYIEWEVIGLDGHPQGDLTKIGQLLNEHVLFDNRVSVQPIRFRPPGGSDSEETKISKIEKPTPKPRIKTNVTTTTSSSSVAPVPPSVRNGFPIRPPILSTPPNFIWREQDRSSGTPASRRRQHIHERHNLPNLTVMNGVTRLIHNGRPLDLVNEEREMIFIAK